MELNCLGKTVGATNVDHSSAAFALLLRLPVQKHTRLKTGNNENLFPV